MYSIGTMKTEIIAFVAIAVTIGLLVGANSASVQAHRYHGGSNYANNNGNDYNVNYSPTYNHYGPHFPWIHHHQPQYAPNGDLNSFRPQDVNINAPTATDNSGDIKANTDTATKQECGDNSICTVNNVNVIGNGDAVALNDNQAGSQDGGSGY